MSAEDVETTDTATTQEDTQVEEQPTESEPVMDPHEIEKQQSEKLKMKYPAVGKPMAGHSAFLQKRLAKGQKYFDSGDYQMAKQAGKGKARTMPMPPLLSVAPEIPTPESVTTRKTSVVQPSKLASTS